MFSTTGKHAAKLQLRLLILLLLFALLFPFASLDAAGQESAMKSPKAFQLGALPLTFEPNVGQAAPSAAFVAHGVGGTLHFTNHAVELALGARSVRQQFEGTNRAALVSGIDQQAGRVNYLLGNDPTKWQSGVATYAGLLYRDLYPGIDLHYVGVGANLKGTYTVAPTADPATIRWRYVGAQQVTIDKTSGALMIALDKQQILQEQAPIAWQIIAGRRTPVAVRYLLADNDSIGFRVAAYDHSRPLIIDPTLTYSTYLGGSGADYAYDIAVNAQGAIYLTGATGSTNFPVANPVQPTLNPSFPGDLFVTKLNANGTLAYSTYLGGNDSDVGFGIAVDGAGNAYVTGESYSNNFPVVNAIQPINPGIQQDVIVFKLNANGNTLLYSTYLGGSNSQTGWDIAVDSAGAAYVTGHTLSPNFSLVNPIQATANVVQDAFVAKLNPAGSALVYSTYLGTNSSIDYGFGIAVDAGGNAYVTGQAAGTGLPVVNALQPNNAGFGDAFVTKINAAGTAFVYSTYLGGAVNEVGDAIAVDSAGNAYVTGYTESTNFPVVNALQPTNHGYADIFVSKLNANGTALLYSTYLGGSFQDYAKAIAVDSGGNAYVSGWTQSYDNSFPVVNAIQWTYGGGDSDIFVSKLNGTGNGLLYSTHLGGSSPFAGLTELGYGLAIDGNGNAYVAGYTGATNFPIAGSPYQASNAGGADIFVSKINDLPLTLPTPTLTPTPVPTATPNPSLIDFTLNVAPPFSANGLATYNITLTSLNGFSGNVQLSVSGLPAKTTGVFEGNPVVLTNGSTRYSRLDVTIGNKARPGTYTLTVTAAGGGKQHSQTVPLVIKGRAVSAADANTEDESQAGEAETNMYVYLPLITSK